MLPSSVCFLKNHFILCWRTLNAIETCLRTVTRCWQKKPKNKKPSSFGLELNYENLKTWLGLYILEVEVKGKHKRLLGSTFSATWVNSG